MESKQDTQEDYSRSRTPRRLRVQLSLLLDKSLTTLNQALFGFFAAPFTFEYDQTLRQH